MFTFTQKANNYAVLEEDGEMVAQVMQGGMFGNDTVVISNDGSVEPVYNQHQLNDALNDAVRVAHTWNR